MSTLSTLQPYLHHEALFHAPYLRRVLNDAKFPIERNLPIDVDDRLRTLSELWERVRPRVVKPVLGEQPSSRAFVGLPGTLRPLRGVAETVIEQEFVRPVFEDIFGYGVENNRILDLEDPDSGDVRSSRRRPDMIVFRDTDTLLLATRSADRLAKNTVVSAVDFCGDALFIVDVKRFDKGIGADEESDDVTAPRAKDASAAVDIEQMRRYLKGCGRNWGILTNGRSWRLMRQDAPNRLDHLRFDIVLFLEDLRGRMITNTDREIFRLFWWLFGPPAIAGGYLDRLVRESRAETTHTRDILRDQAHAAVTDIAQGFLDHPGNNLPADPSQDQLDHLRELALTFLYRLLFVLKAEAQNLLPMRDHLGGFTLYAKYASTEHIFDTLEKIPAQDRTQLDVGFREIAELIALIDGGGKYEVPAYNGGLFDREKHSELVQLKLYDDVIYRVLHRLIYLGDGVHVPYADLDVRDFGDIYEGLLEQRLVREHRDGLPYLSLRNQKSEKKASGSYFTPDALVDHLVRQTVGPLLEACQNDAHRILHLRILDPSMGSGHFLVKVVDTIAWHLTMHCDPVDADAPGDRGPRDYAYWKRKVVEHCIYGIDVNPMAVELAKVALWLHTAARGKPLSFLDHHLKCGNSLIGAPLDRVNVPGLRARKLKAIFRWEARGLPRQPEVANEAPPVYKKRRKGLAPAEQLTLPFRLDTTLFSDIFANIRQILARPSASPADVKEKGRAYATTVEQRLVAYRLLCDLWCAQWFLAEPNEMSVSAYEDPSGLYETVKHICSIPNDAQRFAELCKLQDHFLVKRIVKARDEGYGPRLHRFFHWQLEFPEVAFDARGQLKPSAGFDAVVGNPPWDKLKPTKRDFFGPFDIEVANAQGPSLDTVIKRLELCRPDLHEKWVAYERGIRAFTAFLAESGTYTHQIALVNGKSTGGDPDLFRYFVERSVQWLRPRGRARGMLGLVVPCTLWAAEGCTALRLLLFQNCAIHSLFTFENYRRWAFDIHSSFKFTTFVAQRGGPRENQRFRAAFMLRDTAVLEGRNPQRIVALSSAFVNTVSPGTKALLDVRTRAELRLIEKLHSAHSRLGDPANGWSLQYNREIDMTNDAALFKSREWMHARGFTQILPERDKDRVWKQKRKGPGAVAQLPSTLPAGGEYWVAASANYYRGRGYDERKGTIGGTPITWFVHPDDSRGAASGNSLSDEAFRIIPRQRYAPLYEGRMVHLFDPSQKKYIGGEGRRAAWDDIPFDSKLLCPRVFVCPTEPGIHRTARVGFCDVTGATNERTILACLVPPDVVCGNTVPVILQDDPEDALLLLAILGSFVADFLARLRVSTHLNWTYVASIPLPRKESISKRMRRTIVQTAARLSCTLPELAETWNAVFPDAPWTHASAERNLHRRANLRATLDALVAELYGLTPPEYGYILTTFPLLDRDQPALPGDKFVTEGHDPSKRRGVQGENWEERPWGVLEKRPRSFITRDLALLTFMRRLKYPIPERLDEWLRDVAGIDPEGESSRFRIGEVKDLQARVLRATELGAVAYAPCSQRTDAEEAPDQD